MEISASLVLCLVLATTQAADWSYSGDNGPSTWSQHFDSCGGKKQSPINIVSANVVRGIDLVPFSFSSPYSLKPTGTWKINNNGHSVVVTVPADAYVMSEGGLGAKFKLSGFHFHWGSADSMGSEHTMGGNMYPLEIHYVHFNSKYANVGEALKKSDGLAVLGFLFEIDVTDNTALTPILDKFTDVKSAKAEADISPIRLLDLMGGDASALSQYYRYSGSLTTPDCFESVKWTVFEKVLKVSSAQMAKFRALQSDSGTSISDNFRPVQPINDRTVYASHKGKNSACDRSLSGILSFAVVAIAFQKIFS